MTNAELAVLSLIAEKSRHGYEIEQVIEARGLREWTEIGFSSIYYLLNKLEKSSLITSQQAQPKGKGPARKVYRITTQGRQTHQEAALAALSTPHSGSSPFLLGISNLPGLPREQVLAALREYTTRARERLAGMLVSAGAQQPLPPVAEAIFDYSRVMAEAEIDWIEDFIRQMEERNG